jgi:hypothetical protein
MILNFIFFEISTSTTLKKKSIDFYLYKKTHLKNTIIRNSKRKQMVVGSLLG